MDRLPSPKLIVESRQLAEMIAALAAQPIVAVDTESNSLHAYREKVCLIQFSIPGRDYLLDPLAFSNLSALAPLFADPGIEKVFHAAEYDLLVLKRDFGFRFANLFDTMVAARILGWKKVGLGSVLEAKMGVKLQKKFQRADWGQRPLPEPMLDYARLDTHYLIRLRTLLKKDLQSKNRWPIAAEDFNRMRQVNGTAPEPRGPDIWRINGVRELPAGKAAVLQRLAEYRERKAEAMDRPLFKVISDKTLIAIAEAEPSTNRELGELPGMTPGQVRRHGAGLLAAVRQAEQERPPKPPRRPRQPDDFIERLDALKDWRKGEARKMGVESDVILPRDVMEAIARANPNGREALAGLMRAVPWRLAQFGGQIEGVLAHCRGS